MTAVKETSSNIDSRIIAYVTGGPDICGKKQVYLDIQEYNLELGELWKDNIERNWSSYIKIDEECEILKQGIRVLEEELKIEREQIRVRILKVLRLSKLYSMNIVTQILSMDNRNNVTKTTIQQDLEFLILPLKFISCL
jgi:hypothetical protein